MSRKYTWATTGTECSVCSGVHGNKRVHRGLYACGSTGRKLNASNNIARRTGYKVEVKKIISYIVTYNGLKPISPRGGVTP